MAATRLLFLNRSFWPDPEATGQFLTELSEDLSNDFEIVFIAGPSLHVRARRRWPWARESRGKVTIIRTWGTRLSKRRLPGRLVNLGSYYLLAALAALTLRRPDIIVAQTDPPLLGALGALLKRRWKCRLVYNIRDLYPDVAIANGALKSRVLLGLLSQANRFAYRHSDRIVVLGEDMRQRVLRKNVPADKLAIVTDWVDTGAIRPIDGNQLRQRFGDRFVAMYSGNLGLSQQLEVVLAAADRLREDQRIVFVLIGEGARKQWLIERARALKLPNVQFLPYQPKERLAESLSAADLHLVPLFPGAAGCIVPSKIYGIMAAARPFVAMMEEGAEAARLAREHRIGFVAAPGDCNALAAAIRNAIEQPRQLKDMGLRARRLVEERFDRPTVTRRFGEMLSAVGLSESWPAAELARARSNLV